MRVCDKYSQSQIFSPDKICLRLSIKLRGQEVFLVLIAYANNY